MKNIIFAAAITLSASPLSPVVAQELLTNSGTPADAESISAHTSLSSSQKEKALADILEKNK